MTTEADRELEGVSYRVLEDAGAIEAYVLRVCEAEWDPEDFDEFGADLYDQSWELRHVPVRDIRPQESLLASKEFIADVTPRIETQRDLKRRNVAIPPLILRGGDYLIFDGYARWHLFRERQVAACLAYVSKPVSNRPC